LISHELVIQALSFDASHANVSTSLLTMMKSVRPPPSLDARTRSIVLVLLVVGFAAATGRALGWL
jgi:hypothetical protein